MSSLTLADLIVRGVPLTSREAATLTLAVAGEWERQRMQRGPVSLPATAAIALHSDGHVTFLIAPPATGHDDAAALSALFGELLGIERPRHQAWHASPGRELLATGDRLAPLELPSASLDGFRSALQRFADDEPDTLPAVFRRAASVLQMPADSGAPNVATALSRSTDRRQAPETVAELRRTIRGFEQQVFEGRARGCSPTCLPTRLPTRLPPAAVAAAVALLVLVGLGVTSVTGRSHILRSQAALTEPPARPTRGGVEPAAASTLPQPPVIGVPATASSSAAPLHVRISRQHGRRAVEPRRAPVVASFPGGTRAIAWMSRSQ
jgi:hypothetical protein